MATSRSQRRRQPVRSPQPRRTGAATARTLEPPDHSRDYAYIRQDLILIAIIGGLLFAALIAASFFL
jgi:Ni/Co efflux regulator RcnB